MLEKFRWTSPAGVEIVLPHLSKIRAGLIRKYRKLEEIDMIFSILEEMVDEDTLSKIDDLEQSEMEDLMTEWRAGTAMGESSGSST